MTYIPKNQIQTNLYTSGLEFLIVGNLTDYQGYYWKKSNGHKFTGRTPSDGPNQRLVPIAPPIEEEDQTGVVRSLRFYAPNTRIYDTLTAQRYTPIRIPINAYTRPTANDYKNGFFFRYFAKQRNQNTLFETNESEYELLNKETTLLNRNLYRGIRVRWSISRKEREEIFLVNKNIITNLENTRNFYGLTAYFKDDFDQFYTDKLGIIYLKGKRNYTNYTPVPDRLPPAYQWGNKNTEIVNSEVPKNQNCAICKFKLGGLCTKWNAQVKNNYWCKSYQKIHDPNKLDSLKNYSSTDKPSLTNEPINLPSTNTSNENITTNENTSTGTSVSISGGTSFGGGGGY